MCIRDRPPDERRQVLELWNATAVEPPSALAHELFEAQAMRTPDRVAVSVGALSLTYAELDGRANRLARHLQALGVGPDALVGLCVRRSPQMLVGLLGVLKAGAAYVPLDPNFPAERLAYMVADSGLGILVTEEALLPELPTHQAQIVCLDRDHATLAAEADTPPPCAATPANLAYVIYTSGSTGRPKGVQIEHRALVNFLDSMRNQPGLSQDDVLLAVTTLSFDIAALEIFLPITVGARLELVSREIAVDGEALLALLRQTRATVMQATPATWRLLLEAGWQGSEDLKVLCGGESVPLNLVAQLLDRAASVWNCLLYTSPSPRDRTRSRMPSSA